MCAFSLLTYPNPISYASIYYIGMMIFIEFKCLNSPIFCHYRATIKRYLCAANVRLSRKSAISLSPSSVKDSHFCLLLWAWFFQFLRHTFFGCFFTFFVLLCDRLCVLKLATDCVACNFYTIRHADGHTNTDRHCLVATKSYLCYNVSHPCSDCALLTRGMISLWSFGREETFVLLQYKVNVKLWKYCVHYNDKNVVDRKRCCGYKVWDMKVLSLRSFLIGKKLFVTRDMTLRLTTSLTCWWWIKIYLKLFSI